MHGTLLAPVVPLMLLLKLYIFGIRYDNSVVRRGPIQTLKYDGAYCVTLKNVEFSQIRTQLCLIKLASVRSMCIPCLDNHTFSFMVMEIFYPTQALRT